MVRDMTSGNPTKLIFSFAVPMLIGNVFQQFYNMVDAIIVGRFVGVNALAAVGATGAMSFLILGFVIGLTVGFSVIVSQRFGANDEAGLRQAVTMSVLLSIVGTIVITTASMLSARTLLEFMKTPKDIIDDAFIYIFIICGGIFATIFYNLLSAILRALGDSKTPLIFLIISSIINVILDILFVKTFNMGVAGAAYATVAAQAISGVMCLFYINKKYPILHLHKSDWAINWQTIFQLLKLGLPTAIQNSVTAVGVMIVQTAVNLLGSTVVAAYTAASKVQQLATQPAATFGFAMATYAGQNLGAGRLDRIKTGLKKTILISTVFNVALAAIVMIFGGFFTKLFVSGENTEVIALSKEYLLIVSPFYLVLGLLFIYRSALQGIGNAVIPLVSGAFELIMRVAVAFTLSLNFGYIGICFADPAAWIGATALLIISYYICMHNLVKRNNMRLEAAKLE